MSSFIQEIKIATTTSLDVIMKMGEPIVTLELNQSYYLTLFQTMLKS